MNTTSLAGMVLALGAMAQGKAPVKAPDVTIFLGGFGILEPGARMAARQTAARVFKTIGVSVAWAQEGAGGGSALGAVVHVRLVSGPAPSRFPGEALAYAKPYGDGRQEINIFWDRVRAHSRRLIVPLLAYVIVHEITHILQGIARHSNEGIMKAEWNMTDYDAMLSGSLAFTVEDSALVRSGLERLRGH